MVLGTIEALIADMDEAGVDKSVAAPLDFGVMCKQETDLSIWEINEYIAEAQKKHPDRIIGFVGVDPLRGSEAIHLLEKGVKDWNLSALSKANMSKLGNPVRVTASHRHGTEPCV